MSGLLESLHVLTLVKLREKCDNDAHIKIWRQEYKSKEDAYCLAARLKPRYNTVVHPLLQEPLT